MRPCEQAVSHALLTTSLCGPTRVSLHPDSVTMPPPALPLELLMMIALHITDDRGKLRHGDFNAFLQVNRALYDCLNRTLWKEAAKYQADTQRVITHSIGTNNLAALEFFLELGADVEVGLPAFEITRGLVHRPTALLMAAELDNVPLARLLLEKGAKVHYFYRQGRDNFSPMHAARSAEMVQLLLDHNADPDFHDDNLTDTPLFWCVKRNAIEAMRVILQHSVEVPSFGVLFTAAERNLVAVKLLVEHGADVKQRGYYCNTALHVAAEAGKTDVVRFLVERWPEGKEALNRDGKTPLLSFEEGSGRKLQLSDEERQEIIALLGGPYSEANNDRRHGLLL
jgi:hypothetical protein